MLPAITGTVDPMSLDTVWLTYAELAEKLDITGESARNLVRRRGWPRKPGNDGVQRIGVPTEYLDERAVSSDEAAIVASIIPPTAPPAEGDIEGPMVAALEAHIVTLKGVVDHERRRAEAERERADAERERADGIAVELAKVRADSVEHIATVESNVADLRRVIEAMREPADAARAREAALEARIEAVRAEAAARSDKSWWRRLAG